MSVTVKRRTVSHETEEAARIGRWLVASRRGVVLAYHNVVPDDVPPAGDPALHLPVRTFNLHLDIVQRTHDVVPLDELLERAAAGRRPRAAITFDDAYRGAVTVAVAQLQRRGIPATIFVTPLLLGGRACWWDALAGSARSGLPAAVRHTAMNRFGGNPHAVDDWAASNGVPRAELPDALHTATATELAAAATVPGIAIAAHGWSHTDLTALSRDNVLQEMDRSIHWLSTHFACFSPWLAYPYGRTSPLAEAMARRAGFRGAFLANGGWLARSPADRPFALPRVHVHAHLRPAAFELRASGWPAA